MELSRQQQFEALALPHLHGLYRLAIRLTGNTAMAEDLVQETFLKALQAFPALRDPDRIRPWLCQILSRLALDRREQQSREVLTGDLEELDRFSLYDRIADEDPFPIRIGCTTTSWRRSRTRRFGGRSSPCPTRTGSPSSCSTRRS
jgi:RNA polymerase sigma factor (sigma-70 family)